jgi:hypothetical protein
MALTTEEQATLKSLLEGENKSIIQSYVDSKIAQSLKTYAEKNPVVKDAGAKLELLRAGTEKKIRELEIKTKAIEYCAEHGINYKYVESLGISFNDEKEISVKLGLMAKEVEHIKEKEINNFVGTTSFRPGSGQASEGNNHYGLTPKEWDGLSTSEKLLMSSRKR